MNQQSFFTVAGLTFCLELPASLDVDSLLPSFVPFRRHKGRVADCIFRFVATPEAISTKLYTFLLEENKTEFGRIRLYGGADAYAIEVCTIQGARHCMKADANFTHIEASLCLTDPHVGAVLSSMLRLAFSQAALSYQAVSVHAAAVVVDGHAYLFLGRSGTGKSTHAQLWLKHFANSHLLNDDNPMLRIVDGQIVAYGTPWSGKTACYLNESYSLGGVARLAQSLTNQMQILHDVDAFVALLPSCAVFSNNAHLYTSLCDTLITIADAVTIGRLECRPDEEAARLCAEALISE